MPQKNLTEGISAYAYLFMSSFFGGGHGKWDMKDEKMNDMRGVAPQKTEHSDAEKEMKIIFVTPPPYGFINEILTPPHLW